MLQTWVNVYVQDFHFWIAWVQNQGQTRIIIPEFLTANSLLIHNIAFNTAWSLNIFLFTIFFAKFSSMHMSNVFAQRSKRHFSWSHSKKGLYDTSWYHFFTVEASSDCHRLGNTGPIRRDRGVEAAPVSASPWLQKGEPPSPPVVALKQFRSKIKGFLTSLLSFSFSTSSPDLLTTNPPGGIWLLLDTLKKAIFLLILQARFLCSSTFIWIWTLTQKNSLPQWSSFYGWQFSGGKRLMPPWEGRN